MLTLIEDHYRTQGDTYHREANTLKQQMETLAAKLPDEERLKHVDFTERRSQIKTREQETIRLKKHTALHHEKITHPEATRRPQTTTQPDTSMEMDEPSTPDPEHTLQPRSQGVPKPKGKAGPSREVFTTKRSEREQPQTQTPPPLRDT